MVGHIAKGISKQNKKTLGRYTTGNRDETLTLRPCKTSSQEARLACCAGGLGLPRGCGQVG